jgi:hypothetical protein
MIFLLFVTSPKVCGLDGCLCLNKPLPLHFRPLDDDCMDECQLQTKKVRATVTSGTAKLIQPIKGALEVLKALDPKP